MLSRSFLSSLAVSLYLLSMPIYAASVPGVQNFDKVDERVYRGAQPTDEGFRNLAKLGVKVILDLRETDQRSAVEERVVTAAGMRYVNVPMTGLTPPTDVQITKILTLLEDSASGPTFVHCKRGADRTGAVIAAYQIDFLKWETARALADAKAHGMGYFQLPRQAYIRAFKTRGINSDAAGKPSVAGPTPVIAAPIPEGAQQTSKPYFN